MDIAIEKELVTDNSSSDHAIVFGFKFIGTEGLGNRTEGFWFIR